MTVTAIQPDQQTLLNATVVAYLGYGTAPTPRRDIRAVEALTLDCEVVCGTREVINDVLNFDGEHLPDSDIAAHAKSLHPWLTDDAVAAIVWNYRCGWR